MSDGRIFLRKRQTHPGSRRAAGEMNAKSAGAGQNADAGQSTDTERNAGTVQNAAGAGQARMVAGSRMPAETRVETGISSRASYSGSVSELEPAVAAKVSGIRGSSTAASSQNQQYYNPYQNTAGGRKAGIWHRFPSSGILALVLFCTGTINVIFRDSVPDLR